MQSAYTCVGGGVWPLDYRCIVVQYVHGLLPCKDLVLFKSALSVNSQMDAEPAFEVLH